MRIQDEQVCRAPPAGLKPTTSNTTLKRLGGVASLLSTAVAVVCPACVPAIGSLLAFVGLGFAVSEQFLHPLLVLLLLVSLGSLASSAKLHGRWQILIPGVLGSALIYAGRYAWFSEPAMWTGSVALISTSLVNIRIKRCCAFCRQAQDTKETCRCVVAIAEATLEETRRKLEKLQTFHDALKATLTRWQRQSRRGVPMAAEFCALIESSRPPKEDE